MKQKNNVLRLAIAACFGMAAGQAGAGVVVGTSSAVNFASEIPNNATLVNTGAALDITIPTISALVPTAATPMYVKINLIGGAVWGAAPTLTCGGTAATTAGTIDLGGTVGASNVTFRVTAGSTTLTGTCTAVITSITVSGVTTTDTKTVSAVIEYTDGATQVAVPKVGNYISFSRGVNTTVAAPVTAVQVDATSGSDNWVVGSNLTVGTACIGSVKYGVVNSALNSALAVMDAGSAITSATLTVSGPALVASMSRGVTGIYLAATSSCAAATTAAFTNSASSSSVTFVGLTAAELSAGVAICATVPGNVVITTGQLTASLVGFKLASTQTVDTSATSNNIANVTANGSTRNAYFVNASTSTNKTTVLRIINKSGISGAITATAYDEAGAVLGTANSSLGTIVNNQMMSKTSAELETALGFTPASATAKYSVVLSGAISNFEVLNFTKDNATGNLTLSNTSTTNTQ